MRLTTSIVTALLTAANLMLFSENLSKVLEVRNGVRDKP